jgi:hypothetical protein
MADIPAAQDQLSKLKDEYLQCKQEDASKYALIEVGFLLSNVKPNTNLNI